MAEAQASLPLDGYRALDLTDESGYLCGRILGDLGADVIKVEPPGGDRGRRFGPFYRDDPHPEKSLSWWAYNSNKRGVTLNIETADGQALLKQLVAKAAFLVESFRPGYLDGLGLGYDELEGINPGLVMTSITPFGPTGPHKDYRANDIIVLATGGLMHVCGNEDRAPLRIGVPHAHAQAGIQAALGSLIAHHHRRMTGQGQHVELSMQSAIVNTLMDVQQHWDIDKRMSRRGIRPKWGPVFKRNIYQCKDGYVTWPWFVDRGRGRRNMGLLQWMAEEGADEGLVGWDFEAMTLYTITQEQVDQLEGAVARFFAGKGRREIYDQARKRRFLCFPVYDPKELLEDPQVASRNFFRPVEHPELHDRIRYPGPFVQSSEASYEVRRRPPLIGEHNQEVFVDELGLTREEVATLKEAGVV